MTHGGSRIPIDPRTPPVPGLSTPGFHRPSGLSGECSDRYQVYSCEFHARGTVALGRVGIFSRVSGMFLLTSQWGEGDVRSWWHRISVATISMRRLHSVDGGCSHQNATGYRNP